MQYSLYYNKINAFWILSPQYYINMSAVQNPESFPLAANINAKKIPKGFLFYFLLAFMVCLYYIFWKEMYLYVILFIFVRQTFGVLIHVGLLA